MSIFLGPTALSWLLIDMESVPILGENMLILVGYLGLQGRDMDRLLWGKSFFLRFHGTVV